MMTAYREAIDFLEKYIPQPEKKYPGELGLQRMKYLVGLIGNPQNSYPTIHVTGTSGKGSTATFIASLLCTKYKVGLLTSPHLVKINERIKILENVIPTDFTIVDEWRDLPRSVSWKIPRPGFAGLGMTRNDVSDKDFIELVRKIKPFVEKMEKSEYGFPSYFEIITAMAFLYFAKEKVDIAVVEVGMGGQYDATNVVNPAVAVITNVGLDHTEVLGKTVEEIAKDKAGIIKKGIKVVSGVSQSSVIQTIELTCKRQGATLSLLNRDFSYRIKKIISEGNVFDYYGKKIYRNLKIRLLGEHQVENACLALRVIEELNKLVIPTEVEGSSNIGRFLDSPLSRRVARNDIYRGLLNTFFPGRMEIISNNPLVILDGAHNQDKIKALVAAIKTIFPKKKVTVILAIKNDKNAKDMITRMLSIAHKVIFTQYNLLTDTGITKSYDSTDLFEIAQRLDKKKEMKIDEYPIHALKQTIKEAKKDDLILVTGSLYLIGEIIRNYINVIADFSLRSASGAQ